MASGILSCDESPPRCLQLAGPLGEFGVEAVVAEQQTCGGRHISQQVLVGRGDRVRPRFDDADGSQHVVPVLYRHGQLEVRAREVCIGRDVAEFGPDLGWGDDFSPEQTTNSEPHDSAVRSGPLLKQSGEPVEPPAGRRVG